MINDGIDRDDLDAYLTSRPWLVDHATTVFNTTAESLAADLLAEMHRAGAIEERDGRLFCRAPYHRPATGWRRHPGSPRDWQGSVEGGEAQTRTPR